MTRHMTIENGVLYMLKYPSGGRDAIVQLAVPEGELRERLLHEVHGAPTGGHLKSERMLARLGGEVTK